MRTLALLALVAMLPPLVGAQTVSGNAVGVNGGCVDVGLWDVYWWSTGGGALSLDLTWARLPVLGADYDLMLYRGNALDDGVLTQDELIASAEHHGSGPAHEQLAFASLPGGLYVVAVVPYQAEGETYSLTAPGQLQHATYGPTPGVEAYSPCL